MSVAEASWRWYGSPAHLCVASSCVFHMATRVGDYMISTVGEYYPSNNSEMVTVGCDRYFETMVFEVAGGECECGCGLPDIDFSELDTEGYQTRAEANDGHLKMCKAWALKQ